MALHRHTVKGTLPRRTLSDCPPGPEWPHQPRSPIEPDWSLINKASALLEHCGEYHYFYTQLLSTFVCTDLWPFHSKQIKTTTDEVEAAEAAPVEDALLLRLLLFRSYCVQTLGEAQIIFFNHVVWFFFYRTCRTWNVCPLFHTKLCNTNSMVSQSHTTFLLPSPCVKSL